MRLQITAHMDRDDEIHAQTSGGGRYDWLVLGRVILWPSTPEQAEAISAAALDLAERMRAREPDALARVHRALDALDSDNPNGDGR